MQAILAENSNYFWLPRQASTVAAPTDNLFNVILWLCVFFFLLITVLLVFFVIKYRHKPGEKRDVSASHSMTLEITWTVIPSIIVVFLYYYGFKEYMNMAVEPPNAYPITATGRMWQWSFSYDNGTYTDPELHVPVNIPVRLVLQSDDVIHSLYIPEFRVKKDVVPGRFNRMWFQATSADGHMYVTTATINGQATEIGVDANGKAIGASTLAPNLTVYTLDSPKLDKKIHDAVLAAAGTATTRPSQPVSMFAMLNGANVYMSPTPGGELILDSNGITLGDKQFQIKHIGDLPADIQEGLTAQAGGTIDAAQNVWDFFDAEQFDIYCAAYCGTNHSIMRSRVIVHRTMADFNAWLAVSKVPTGTPAEIGQKLYQKLGCSGCHSVDGSKVTGPSWKDLYGSVQQFSDGSTTVVDQDFLHTFLPNPTLRVPVGFPPVMPPFPLKDEQINAIAAYMETISKNYHGTVGSQLGTGPMTMPSTQPATAPAAK